KGNDTGENSLGKVLLYKVNFSLQREYLSDGYFKDLKSLLQNFQSRLCLLTVEQKFATCDFKQVNQVIHFSDRLSNVLGFREDSVQQKKYSARFPFDSLPGLNCFLLYTDFIEHSYVGDTKASLLRMLPLQNVEYGSYMSFYCYPRQFKKVLSKEISSARIILRDDSGNEIPFTSQGRVVLTLEFQRKWSSTFIAS